MNNETANVEHVTYVSWRKTSVAALLVLALVIPPTLPIYSAPPTREVPPEGPSEPGHVMPPGRQGGGYDGRTLYKSFFFADGPVVSKIPTLQKIAPRVPAEYKRVEPQVMSYIQQKDPTFFERFGREIQSGDRVKVAQALKHAHTVTIDALSAVTKSSPLATNVTRLSRTNRAEPDEPENDANVAVEILVWIAVFVVVFWANPDERAQALSGLSFDRYVDEIVRAVPKSNVGRLPAGPTPAGVKQP